MSKIATTVNDLLHLEVDASDILNQIANHSAQTGNTSGWTADAGITLAAVANPKRVRDNLCTYDPDFEATTFTGSVGGTATVSKDTSWFNDGARSVKIVPTGNNNSGVYPTGTLATSASQARLGLGVTGTGTGPGVPFTISATIRLTAAQASSNLSTLARRIVVGIRDSTGTDNIDVYRSDAAPNAAGIYRLKVTAYVKVADQNVTVRLMNGSDLAGDVVWWDSLLVESGITTGVWSETLQGLGAAETITATNVASNPKAATVLTYWTAGGGTPTLTREATDGPDGQATFARTTFGAGVASNAGLQYGSSADPNLTSVPGDYFAVRAWLRCSRATRLGLYLQYLDSGGATLSSQITSAPVPAATWTEFQVITTAPAPAGTTRIRLLGYVVTGAGTVALVAGDTIDMGKVMVSKDAVAFSAPPAYVDGDLPQSGGTSYRWLGAANLSSSQAYKPAISAAAGKAIRATYASPATIASGVLSPSFTVAPGQKIGIQFSASDSAQTSALGAKRLYCRTSVLYYDAGGNPVGSPLVYGALQITANDPWRMTVNTERSYQILSDQTVPAGAATARFKIAFADKNLIGGTSDPITRPVFISRVMIVAAANDDAAKNVPFTDAASWQNLAGSSINVHISRGGDVSGVEDGIDSGTITATILDANVDPNNNPRIRPGRKLRLTMANPNGDGTFLPIFTGSLTEVNVDYSDLKRATNPRPRVSIVGTDAVSDLRGVASPYNYSGTLGQKVRALMASTTVAYSTDAGAVSTTKTSRNDSATLWDQLLLARNSFVNGKVWVDQLGVLNAKVSTAPYGASVLTFSDLAGLSYSKIETTFGSKNLVNSLTITRTNADEVDGEKTYGPYLHGASIAAWRTVSADLDVIDGTPSTIATALLQRFGTPTVFPHSIEFSALDDQAWAASAALVELYALVQVNYSKAGVSSQAFVIGIDHDITARGWYVTLTLRPSDATTAATITNGSGGMSAGPGDVIAPIPGPYAWRTQSTQTSYATATWTSLELDTNQVMDGGITYDTTNRRFTVPRAGRWLVNFAVTWSPATAGRRVLRVLVNGQDTPPAVQSTHPAPAAASGVNNLVTMTVSKVIKCNAGDTIQPQVYQDSGAALLVYVVPVTDNYAELTYLGL